MQKGQIFVQNGGGGLAWPGSNALVQRVVYQSLLRDFNYSSNF